MSFTHMAHVPRYLRVSSTAEAVQRVVYTLHGIHVHRAGSAVRQATFTAVERRLKNRTAHFVTVSDSDLAQGARLGVINPERATRVHNGIEPHGLLIHSGTFRAELGVTNHVPLMLAVGRMEVVKDQRTLLDSWKLVIEQLPEAVLALIGSGPLEAELREHAIALGLGASMRFVAPRPDLTHAYADADAFVLSSLWEGLPYVILEAMDAGLPVVSTDVDGIPEAVDDGVTGLLVPRKTRTRLPGLSARSFRIRPCRVAWARRVRAKWPRSSGWTRMVARLLDVYREVSP